MACSAQVTRYRRIQQEPIFSVRKHEISQYSMYRIPYIIAYDPGSRVPDPGSRRFPPHPSPMQNESTVHADEKIACQVV